MTCARSSKRIAVAVVLGAFAALAGCKGTPAEVPPSVQAKRAWSVPAPDVGPSCSDVADVRVCWDDGGRATLVARTLPAEPAPTPLGFRCTGGGSSRTCEARDDVGPFVCAGATCTQSSPRQPDDGQWQCADDPGATVCVGGEPAAGVVRGSVAPGWLCGPRRDARARARPDERVCVDFAPDVPGGVASAERCRWTYARGATRTCTHDPEAHGLGDACGAQAPCVVGARCVSGRCVPPRPFPSCAIASDCPDGACRFGSCVEADR